MAGTQEKWLLVRRPFFCGFVTCCAEWSRKIKSYPRTIFDLIWIRAENAIPRKCNMYAWNVPEEIFNTISKCFDCNWSIPQGNPELWEKERETSIGKYDGNAWNKVSKTWKLSICIQTASSCITWTRVAMPSNSIQQEYSNSKRRGDTADYCDIDKKHCCHLSSALSPRWAFAPTNSRTRIEEFLPQPPSPSLRWRW